MSKEIRRREICGVFLYCLVLAYHAVQHGVYKLVHAFFGYFILCLLVDSLYAERDDVEVYHELLHVRVRAQDTVGDGLTDVLSLHLMDFAHDLILKVAHVFKLWIGIDACKQNLLAQTQMGRDEQILPNFFKEGQIT